MEKHRSQKKLGEIFKFVLEIALFASIAGSLMNIVFQVLTKDVFLKNGVAANSELSFFNISTTAHEPIILLPSFSFSNSTSTTKLNNILYSYIMIFSS